MLVSEVSLYLNNLFQPGHLKIIERTNSNLLHEVDIAIQDVSRKDGFALMPVA